LSTWAAGEIAGNPRTMPDPWQVEWAREWLARLGDDPRPCREVLRNHPHPQDELRGGLLIEIEAFVAFAVNDAAASVRVLYLGRLAPPEMVFRLP
jgi:hypothetical protein